MTSTRHFLPWYRAGLTTALKADPPPGSSRAPLPVAIGMSGSSPSRRGHVPVELAGPGDVAGMDPAQVLRCEPFDTCPDFEPGYFPYVELADPDLPWRFSPTAPADLSVADPEHRGTTRAGTRLRPWLALVVVPAALAAVAPAPRGGLPVLSTDAAQLPPPAESWAWAHVQVTTEDGTAVEDALADPSRRVSRILCPRRLAGSQQYRALLVPTFAAGRAAFGGDPLEGEPLDWAWPQAGPVRLPVYYQWSFATAPEGTFEALARRLRPRLAPPDAAGRAIGTADPGWGLPLTRAGPR